MARTTIWCCRFCGTSNCVHGETNINCEECGRSANDSFCEGMNGDRFEEHFRKAFEEVFAEEIKAGKVSWRGGWKDG